MCDKKIENGNGVCINTSCDHNLLCDSLYLVHPNFNSLVGWALMNCDYNLEVLEEMELRVRLRYVGEMWGMTKQNVSLIEQQAIKKFRENFKIIVKEEQKYGEDQSERPR